jgi:hypothetical protein
VFCRLFNLFYSYSYSYSYVLVLVHVRYGTIKTSRRARSLPEAKNVLRSLVPHTHLFMYNDPITYYDIYCRDQRENPANSRMILLNPKRYSNVVRSDAAKFRADNFRSLVPHTHLFMYNDPITYYDIYCRDQRENPANSRMILLNPKRYSNVA